MALPRIIVPAAIEPDDQLQFIIDAADVHASAGVAIVEVGYDTVDYLGKNDAANWDESGDALGIDYTVDPPHVYTLTSEEWKAASA